MGALDNSGEERHWPHAAIALLGGAALLAVVFQYTTLAKFAVLSPGAGFVTWREFWQRVATDVPLNGSDAVLPLLMLCIGISLSVLELRRGLVTQLLLAVTSSETWALGGVFVGSLFCVRYYFAPGQLAWGGDAAEHILYVQIASRSFAAGEWPIWTNYLAGGSPFLQFYGFLFFYLAGAVELLLGDVFTSIKLVAGLAHALSGPAMYLLVRTATRSRQAGLVAGLAYVLCFWHAQQIVVMGRWPLSLFYPLLPLPFYAFEMGRLPRCGVPAIVGGGWALAGLAFTHPGYAFWATLLLIIYIGLRTVVLLKRRRGRQWLWCGVSILAVGLLVGAYLTLPMWLEREYTGLAAGVELSGVPDPGWRQLFSWSNFRWRFDELPVDQRHWYGGYLGLSLGVLALGGMWTVRRRLGGGVGIAGCGLFVSLFVVLGYRWVEFLPMVSSLNAGRYLLFTAFFLAYVAGGGLLVLGRLPGLRSWGPRLLTAAIALIAVDLGPTTFQHPYLARSDPSPVGYPVDMLEEFSALTRDLPEGALPGFRLHPTTEKIHPFSAIGWLAFKTGIPQMHSLFMEAPQASRKLHDPWRKMLDGELDRIESGGALQSHPEYEFIYGGARLQNLRYLLTVLPQAEGQPHRHTRIGWADSTPLLVAAQTIPFPAAEFARARLSGDMEQMVRAAFPKRKDIAMLLDAFPALWTIRITAPYPEGLSCDAVVLIAGGAKRDLGTKPQAEILKHRVENQRVAIQMQVDAACFARLAYAHYPYLQVRVDGKEVESWPTAGGFIAIELVAGRHQIELVPYLSPLRRAMLGILLVLLVVSGGNLWWWFSRG